MATCPNCNAELPEPTASSCPECGHAWGTLDLGLTGQLSVTRVEVGYGAAKSWREQWGQVERAYAKLQGFYDGPGDNQEVLSAVKDFFVQSWHLSDWLQKDSESGVTGTETYKLLNDEPDMDACNAVANTSKHHTRDKGKLTAYVSKIVVEPKCEATIEILRPGGTEVRDALGLATSCMAIWRKFLADHSLTV